MSVDRISELLNTVNGNYRDERLRQIARRVLEQEFQGSASGYTLTCCKCQTTERTECDTPVHLCAVADQSVAPPVVRAVLTVNHNFICKACAAGQASPPGAVEVPTAPTGNGCAMIQHNSGAADITAAGPTTVTGIHGSGATVTERTARPQRASASTALVTQKGDLAHQKPGRTGQTHSQGATAGLGSRLGGLAGGIASAVASVALRSGPVQDKLPQREDRLAEPGKSSHPEPALEAYGAGNPAHLGVAEMHEAVSEKVYSRTGMGLSLQSARTTVHFTRYYDVTLVPAGQQPQQHSTHAQPVATRLHSAASAAEWAAQHADQLSPEDVQLIRRLDFAVVDPGRRTLAHILAAVADWVLSPQAIDAAAGMAATNGAAASAGPSSRGGGAWSTTPARSAVAAGSADDAHASLLFRLQPWAFAIREVPDIKLHGSMVRPSVECMGGRTLGKPPTSLLELVNAPPLKYSVARERLAADDGPQVWDAEYETQEGAGPSAPGTVGKSRRQPGQQRPARAGKAAEDFRAGWALPLHRLSALVKRFHKRTYGAWKVSAKQLSNITREMFDGDALYGSHLKSNQPSGGGGSSVPLPPLESLLRDLGVTHKQVMEVLNMEEIDANVGFCAECGFLGDLVACEACVDSFCCRCIGCKSAEDLPDPWNCKYCIKIFRMDDVAAAAAAPAKQPAVKQEPGASAADSDDVVMVDEPSEQEEEEEEVSEQAARGNKQRQGRPNQPKARARASTGGATAAAAAAAAAGPSRPTASAPPGDAAAGVAVAGSKPASAKTASGSSQRGRQRVQPRSKVDQLLKRGGAEAAGLPPRVPTSRAAAAGEEAAVAQAGGGRPRRAAAAAAAKLLSPPASGGRRRRGAAAAASSDEDVESSDEEESVEDEDEEAQEEEEKAGRKPAPVVPAGTRAKRAAEGATGGKAELQAEGTAGAGGSAVAAKRRRQSEPVRGQRKRPAVSGEDEASEEEGEESGEEELEEEVMATAREELPADAGVGGKASQRREGGEEEEDFRSAASDADAQGSPGGSDAAAGGGAAAAGTGTGAPAAAGPSAGAAAGKRGGKAAAPAAAAATAVAGETGALVGGRPQRRAARGVAKATAAAAADTSTSSGSGSEEEESGAGGRAGSKRQRDADFKPSQESDESEEEEEEEDKSGDEQEEPARGGRAAKRSPRKDAPSEEETRVEQPVVPPQGRAADATAPAPTGAEAPAAAKSPAAAKLPVAANAGGGDDGSSTEGEPIPDSEDGDSDMRIVGEKTAARAGAARGGGAAGRGRGRGSRPPTAARGRGGRPKGSGRGAAGGADAPGRTGKAPRRTGSLQALATRRDLGTAAGAAQADSDAMEDDVIGSDSDTSYEDASRAKRQRRSAAAGRAAAGPGRGRGGGRRGGRTPQLMSPGGVTGSMNDQDAAAALMLLNGRSQAATTTAGAGGGGEPDVAAPGPSGGAAAADATAPQPPPAAATAAADAGPSAAPQQPAGGADVPAARQAAAAAATPPAADAAPDGFVLRPTAVAGGMQELVFSKAGALKEGLRLMHIASAQRVRQGLVNAWLVAVNAALERYDAEGMPENLSRVLHGLTLCFGNGDATLEEKQAMLQALVGMLQHSVALAAPHPPPPAGGGAAGAVAAAMERQ